LRRLPGRREERRQGRRIDHHSKIGNDGRPTQQLRLGAMGAPNFRT
jgi:hypothetical protein